MPEQRNRDLVLLLTAQHSEKNPWWPNQIGIKRADAAARRLNELPEARLAICGGYRNHFGYSYADRLAVWFTGNYSQHINRLLLVSGSSNNSKHDIRNVSQILRETVWPHEPSETTVHLATEFPHFNRARLTALALGYKAVLHADSGADAGTLYSPADDAMAQETDRDKILGRGPDQVKWNLKSDEQAERQRIFCAQWAQKNPTLDGTELRYAARVINNLRESGVRFA